MGHAAAEQVGLSCHLCVLLLHKVLHVMVTISSLTLHMNGSLRIGLKHEGNLCIELFKPAHLNVYMNQNTAELIKLCGRQQVAKLKIIYMCGKQESKVKKRQSLGWDLIADDYAGDHSFPWLTTDHTLFVVDDLSGPMNPSVWAAFYTSINVRLNRNLYSLPNRTEKVTLLSDLMK